MSRVMMKVGDITNLVGPLYKRTSTYCLPTKIPSNPPPANFWGSLSVGDHQPSRHSAIQHQWWHKVKAHVLYMATKNNSREDRFLQVLGKSFYIVNVLIRQQPLGGDGGGVEGKRGRHIFCNTKAMCREFYGGGGSKVELLMDE